MAADPQLPEELREALRKALLDNDAVAARRLFASSVAGLLSNVGSWLAIDSWLGAGKVADDDPTSEHGEAFAEFRGVATVVCIATELATTAVTASENGQAYAAAAIVRQLIECEYLLTLFADDLDHARRWRDSTPEDLRAEFTPAKMRRLTGFSNEEYWNHCDTGGHPNPKGARLLEWLDPARHSWPYAREELAIDLGLHLRRTWKAVDRVLTKHHARYANVHATDRLEADRAWTDWHEADEVVNAFTGAATD